MSEPNYAGNIIVNLASLPDFLRRPILTRRLREFFAMGPGERREIVDNALAAGPDIPFPNFARLCRTWLEVLSTFDERERLMLFGAYVDEISRRPEKIIRFNLDGILEIFTSLDDDQQRIIGATIVHAVSCLDDAKRALMLRMIPDNAKRVIGM